MTTALRILLLLCLASASGISHAASDWPLWQDFAKRFVEDDGRVVDVTFERKSTSEGQSYGLFFALVANDRDRFDKILTWTSANLAAGQLGDTLPAWLWGRRDDGSWGVKDKNPASDADLWMAYSLLEAARLWDAPQYADIADRLLRSIEQLETVYINSDTALLLPGQYGFKLANGRHRIVTSYMPGFMFRYLAAADPRGPWQDIWDSFVRMTPQLFSTGIAPDVFVVDADGRVLADTEAPPSASYDAIRVYLWAGMSHNSENILKLLSGYAALMRDTGLPPEKVNPLSGIALKSSYSPIGFSAAVLPYLAALGEHAQLEKQRQRLQGAQNKSPHYYEQSLILFGNGWQDGQYRFDDAGRLQPQWLRTAR